MEKSVEIEVTRLFRSSSYNTWRRRRSLSPGIRERVVGNPITGLHPWRLSR
jgi:hypothetical protein